MPQISRLFVPRQDLNSCFWQVPSCKFGRDLALQGVAASAFQISGENQRRRTGPDMCTILGAEQRRDSSPKRLRKSSQVMKLSLPCQSHSKLANATLGPGSLQPSHSSLRARSEAHPREEQDVIEIPVPVEIQRKEMGMLMPLEGRPSLVFACEFRTVRPITATCMGDQRTV